MHVCEFVFLFASRRRHTRCALVTGVQTCALPILERAGKPLVLALARRLAPEVVATLVSANRNADHYLSHGLRAIHDRIADIGPLGGIEALAAACQTPWLLTVPVDVVDVNDCLVRSLRAAGPGGAWAEDDDGPQPLVALWPVEILRTEVAKTVASGDFAVHALQARMGMMPVRLAGLRFGTPTTPADQTGKTPW